MPFLNRPFNLYLFFNNFINNPFNVPMDKGTNDGADDKRIRESLPTINYLIERDAKVILCSHLGRPDGRLVDSLRMDKVAVKLQQLLNRKVKKLNDCIEQRNF